MGRRHSYKTGYASRNVRQWRSQSGATNTRSCLSGLQGKRIVDLGCLEGGHTTEFARLGMRALGVEARKSNFANCMTVKAAVDLPGLSFVLDTVWNAAKYGPFDAVWCCGILYHLDRPREFMRMMSASCRKIMMLVTEFAATQDGGRWNLSAMAENEALAGRWYHEHDGLPEHVENAKWAAWENQRSFWPTRPCLVQTLHEKGFDCVLEQYDWLGPPLLPAISEFVSGAAYDRGVFIGVRAGV
ncbi:MAG: class I SAM-dependent methyltransferase [Methylocella sp.]